MDITPFLLFARHQEDPALQAIAAVVTVVLAIIVLLFELTARYDVVTKSGAPYCPRCHRQVSFRRDSCRCCGYHFKTYGSPSPPQSTPAAGHDADISPRKWSRIAALQEEVDRKARVAEFERNKQMREAKAAEIAARKAARDETYRAKGIEPGPMAWYRALPDLTQAIVLGLAMAAPATAVLVAIFVAMSR